MNRNINKSKPKTLKWYLDKLLILAVVAMVIAGIAIMIIASDNDDTAMVVVGVAMLPGAGLLITPRVIISAIRESRGWKNSMLDSKLLREDFFREVSDPSPYHKRICRAVIREALLNFLALIGVLAFFIVAGVITLNGDIDTNAFIVFLIMLGILIFIIPILAYNITCAACRIRIALRSEYAVYHSQVKTVAGYDMKIVGKYGVYKFKYCKCIGIKADNVFETDAVLAFVPDEVFLFPDEER